MQLNTLGLVHDFLRHTVRPGAVCVDATAGKVRVRIRVLDRLKSVLMQGKRRKAG